MRQSSPRPLPGHAREDLRRYLVEKLRQRHTYGVALVVGLFINLYGHVLVPWLRGEQRPVARFVEQLAEAPAVVGFSIVVAFLFPLLVGVYSSVTTRISTRDIEYRAQFPDLKPDPVFRADESGSIVDLGDKTRELFARHAITTGQHFLGDATWQKLWLTRATPEAEPAVVFSETLGAWFSISTAPGPGGTLNVYATRTSRPHADAAASG